jgi:hypothetical protein
LDLPIIVRISLHPSWLRCASAAESHFHSPPFPLPLSVLVVGVQSPDDEANWIASFACRVSRQLVVLE